MPPPRPRYAWYWLLVIPYFAVMAIPTFNRLEPTLFGIPFFYWYQLLWVVLSSMLIALVYRRAHGGGKPRREDNNGGNEQ
jgi:hypothetical protein